MRGMKAEILPCLPCLIPPGRDAAVVMTTMFAAAPTRSMIAGPRSLYIGMSTGKERLRPLSFSMKRDTAPAYSGSAAMGIRPGRPRSFQTTPCIAHTGRLRRAHACAAAIKGNTDLQDENLPYAG